MTSADDTIVNYRNPKPSPGGRLDQTRVNLPQTPKSATAVSNPPPEPREIPVLQPETISFMDSAARSYENKLNPLLAAAQPLVDEVAWLNNTGEASQPESYRERLAHKVSQFERQCGMSGVDEDSILYARYVLCTVLDEMVNKTPWPDKGEWNRQSLLARFHGETGGGEKFFDLLDHLQLHPATHLAVLELMFVCLNLGFEGKYHLVPRGYLQLEQVKDNLFQLIRLQRGEPEQSLSPHGHSVSGRRHKLIGYLPAWVILAVTGLLLLTMFSGFRFLIDEQGDRVAQEIQNLPVEATSPSSLNRREGASL